MLFTVEFIEKILNPDREISTALWDENYLAQVLLNPVSIEVLHVYVEGDEDKEFDLLPTYLEIVKLANLIAG